MPYVGIDFETYASTDITVHGLDNYLKCDNFKPLLMALAVETSEGIQEYIFDLLTEYEAAVKKFEELREWKYVFVAHNADFERGVLEWMGLYSPGIRLLDSAAVSRALGGGSSLEAAAPQLLGTEKMAAGKDLIMLFSVPQKDNETGVFDPSVVEAHPDKFVTFKEYCQLDAKLSLQIGKQAERLDRKQEGQRITSDMNFTGWHVDTDLVRRMMAQAEKNREVSLKNFHRQVSGVDLDTASPEVRASLLNFNSPVQLAAWCKKRGVNLKSFDEMAVEKALVRITKKMESLGPGEDKFWDYSVVRFMLETKQILGGSSLSKLQKILDLVGPDDILRHQYLHQGAGQTGRTSGRGVQMQNLKRLNHPVDVGDPSVIEGMTNSELAENIRQVFTSRHPQGELVVGDLASIESRGLALLSGNEKKLDQYRRGLDIYKALAAEFDGVPYDQVTKERRTFGKVGELSCGYQAGAVAVRDFAEKMGTILTPQEAQGLVTDWRGANEDTVELWRLLNELLWNCMETKKSVSFRRGDYIFSAAPRLVPLSLREQLDAAGKPAGTHFSVVIFVQRVGAAGLPETLFSRVFHGMHIVGRELRYFKPSARKTGDLWNDHYVNQKTKRLTPYTIYGGKLSGILTQSFCRELFFKILHDVDSWVSDVEGLYLVGQFHDEIVLDWTPECPLSVEEVRKALHLMMVAPQQVAPKLPMGAEVHSAYRYIK